MKKMCRLTASFWFEHLKDASKMVKTTLYQVQDRRKIWDFRFVYMKSEMLNNHWWSCGVDRWSQARVL